MKTVQLPSSLTGTYFRQLFEHLGVATIATDTDLNITAWNNAATRMFGAAEGTMVGTPIRGLLPHEPRGSIEPLLHNAIATGEVSDFEFHDRDAQGRTRELIAIIAPIVTEDGSRIGATLCVRDITRRITLQNEIHQHRKMAALGEMAGSIAHYFNNTIGGVVTSIDFANASDDPEIKDRVLAQTNRSLARMTALIRGLLAFAEGEQRSDDLADFTEVLSELADDFDEEAKKRGVQFVLNMPELPVLPVQRSPLSTVLRNITQNALEAMPNGGELRIEVSREEKRLFVRVFDTGQGMDEAAMQRLFEPFWSTKKRRGLGVEHASGLGLAVAHGIIHMLGGTITATSEPGKGSCFSVSLPLPDPSEE